MTTFYPFHRWIDGGGTTGTTILGFGGWWDANTSESGSSSDFLTGWYHYAEFTPQYNPNETLTGFPLLISAAKIPYLWDYAKPDLSDVRASDTGNNLLPCHIIYNGPQDASIVVRLDKTTSNQTVRIHFGNALAEVVPVTGAYGQYHTYSGMAAAYPSGAGNDVSMCQRHLTMSNTPTYSGGPVSGLKGSIYAGATGFASGFNIPTGGLSTFIYPLTDFQDATIRSVMAVRNTDGSGMQHMEINELVTGVILNSTSGAFGATANTGEYTNKTWNHIGGAYRTTDRYVVLNTNKVEIDSDIGGGTGYIDTFAYNRLDMGKNPTRDALTGVLSFSFVHSGYIPTGWPSYMARFMDQHSIYGEVTLVSSGIYVRSNTITRSFGAPVSSKGLYCNSQIFTQSYSDLSLTSTGLKGWSQYIQVTPINPSETLSGFPLVLDLTLLSGISGICRADGLDIVVTDEDNVRLPSDLIYYSGGSGLLVFNPGIKTTSTQSYRIWTNNPTFSGDDPTGTYGKYNTYYTGMFAYYPTGSYLDRTRNQANLTFGARNGGALVPTGGPYTSAIATHYTASGHPYSMYTGSLPTGGTLTFLSWIYVASPRPSRGTLISLSQSGDLGKNLNLTIQENTATTNNFLTETISETIDDPSIVINTNTWAHGASRFLGVVLPPESGGGAKYREHSLFSNGTGYIAEINEDIDSRTHLMLGSNVGSVAFIPQDQIEAPLAFCQVHSGYCSSGWITYDYLMGKDHRAFWSVGTLQSGNLISASAISYVYTNSYYSPYLNKVINVQSQTVTSFTSEADRNRKLDYISDIHTDSSAQTSRLRKVNVSSNTLTSSTYTALILQHLQAIFDVHTSSEFNIGFSNVLELESMAQIKTASHANASMIRGLRSEVEAKTADSGLLVRDVRILTDSQTETALIGAVTVGGDVDISMISNVLTSLQASAIIQLNPLNSRGVNFTVYITMHYDGTHII